MLFGQITPAGVTPDTRKEDVSKTSVCEESNLKRYRAFSSFDDGIRARHT